MTGMLASTSGFSSFTFFLLLLLFFPFSPLAPSFSSSFSYSILPHLFEAHSLDTILIWYVVPWIWDPKGQNSKLINLLTHFISGAGYTYTILFYSVLNFLHWLIVFWCKAKVVVGGHVDNIFDNFSSMPVGKWGSEHMGLSHLIFYCLKDFSLVQASHCLFHFNLYCLWDNVFFFIRQI